MKATKTSEVVGAMIQRQLKSLPDDRQARKAFDEYVRAVARGGRPVQLSELELRVLQFCDRRALDKLPKEIGDLLGFAEGKTYRDAINLCEKENERAKDEKQEVQPDQYIGKRVVDRRRSDRRQNRLSEFVRALRGKLSR